MFHSEKRMDNKFRRRLRRRLYYGDGANLETPSLPLTELAVDFFHDAAPNKLGHVDVDSAANIIRENKVTPGSMVVSVLYGRRLRQRSKQYLETMSSSDVFFISMMMASKYMYDEGTDEEVFNDEWAVSVDQDVPDVNKMEMDFLQAMDWKLLVRPEEFEQTLQAIEKRLALREGMKRGWLTYAELDILMGPDMIGHLWSSVGAECSKLMACLSGAYLTGLLSMIGSVALASQLSAPLSAATVTLLTSLHSSPLDTVRVSFPVESNSTKIWLNQARCDGLDKHLGSCLFPIDAGPDLTIDDRGGKSLMKESNPELLKLGVNEINVEASGKNGEKNADDSSNVEVATENGNRKFTSSLWSLLFVDSLLSQILSLPSFRFKRKHVNKLNPDEVTGGVDSFDAGIQKNCSVEHDDAVQSFEFHPDTTSMEDATRRTQSVHGEQVVYCCCETHTHDKSERRKVNARKRNCRLLCKNSHRATCCHKSSIPAMSQTQKGHTILPSALPNRLNTFGVMTSVLAFLGSRLGGVTNGPCLQPTDHCSNILGCSGDGLAQDSGLPRVHTSSAYREGSVQEFSRYGHNLDENILKQRLTNDRLGVTLLTDSRDGVMHDATHDNLLEDVSHVCTEYPPDISDPRRYLPHLTQVITHRSCRVCSCCNNSSIPSCSYGDVDDAVDGIHLGNVHQHVQGAGDGPLSWFDFIGHHQPSSLEHHEVRGHRKLMGVMRG